MLVHNSGGACPRDALGRFTSEAGGESDAAAAGRSAHENYGSALGNMEGDYFVNRSLPGETLLRPDAYSPSLRIIRELKPDNPGAIASGLRQLSGYKAYMEDLTGEEWTTILDTYKQ